MGAAYVFMSLLPQTAGWEPPGWTELVARPNSCLQVWWQRVLHGKYKCQGPLCQPEWQGQGLTHAGFRSLEQQMRPPPGQPPKKVQTKGSLGGVQGTCCQLPLLWGDLLIERERT